MNITLKKEKAVSDAMLGQQLMSYARSLQEEGQQKESKEANEFFGQDEPGAVS